MKSDPEFSVVAIDGPAASGKSTVARGLARRLNYSYVNSGALYRAVAWFACERELRADDASAIYSGIRDSVFDLTLRDRELQIRIDHIDPMPFLRDEAVNSTVSPISAIPEIREFLVTHLREFLSLDNLVMEGRDIGSVVFPDTPYKFYIHASLEVRAHRRAAQGQSDDLSLRDRVDSSRRASPLTVADDAHVIDSSALTIDRVVDVIVERLKIKGLPAALRLNS